MKLFKAEAKRQMRAERKATFTTFFFFNPHNIQEFHAEKEFPPMPMQWKPEVKKKTEPPSTSLGIVNR